MKEFLAMIRTALILLALLWAIFTFVIGIKMAPNDDMRPAIKAGDIMIYYRLDTKVSDNDVIVVKKNGTDYVGRVIARGGSTIDISDEENVFVDGNLLTEDGIYTTTPRYEGFVEYPLKLAQDEYFVMVDQRNGGEDSRYYGPVKKSEIKGTVAGVYRRSGF